MKHTISHLVDGFERGRITRRQLIQALTMVAAAGSTASAAGLQAGSINHASVLVRDMPRSIEFYGRVFGLTLVNEDKPNKIARLGAGGRILVSLRIEPPAGTIDHFAIGVQNYNKEAVTRDLKEMGLTPRENIEYGFYVDDPDGAHVQITGI
jgi:catechol 2,3-dioxygenase-like lactoylglutathione lyase family enzyme